MAIEPTQVAAQQDSRLGRAVLRAHLNLVSVPDGPATVVFDAARRAGRAMDLAMRIRRQGRVEWSRLEAFGRLVGVSEFDLKMWCLPSLEKAGILEILRGPEGGSVLGVEEQVGVAAPVLVQAAMVWNQNGPTDMERCAIASSDALSYAPAPETQHRAMLEHEGFPAELHEQVIDSLRVVGMARRQRSETLGDFVLYSPYVWGSEAIEIAEFMSRLPPNEQEALATLSRTALENPGVSLDALSSSDRLLAGARKVGLIDSTRVLTQGGSERSFAFSPGLERSLGFGATDVAHERKLFVAHILYGHRYEAWGRGRISNPLVLVDALIRKGHVGPTTSIKEDYPLLEAHGIVAVDEQPGGRAYLRLVKQDVAEDSLELLRLALGEDQPASAEAVDGLWLPGTFTTPERDRARLPEIEPSSEADVLNSVVDQLHEETQRKLRGEDA